MNYDRALPCEIIHLSIKKMASNYIMYLVGYHMQYTVLLLERIPNDDIPNNYTYNEFFFFFLSK